MKYDKKVKENPKGRKTYFWTLVGPEGGVHIWAEFLGPDDDFMFYEKCFGGIEVHYRKPVYDWSDKDKPDHEHCWLLDGPCWHDGSSLYFSDHIAPLIQDNPDDFDDYMKGELLSWYKSHLDPSQDIEPELI